MKINKFCLIIVMGVIDYYYSLAIKNELKSILLNYLNSKKKPVRSLSSNTNIHLNFEGWVKFINYQQNTNLVSQPKAFYINEKFNSTLNHEMDSVDFKYPQNNQSFFAIMTDTTIFFKNQRDNSFIMKNINISNVIYDSIVEYGHLKEGFCFHFDFSSVNVSVERWVICADNQEKEKTFINSLKKLIPQASASNHTSNLNNTISKLNITNGYWIPSGNWTECSSRCGGGYQFMNLTCIQPTNGGEACQGSNVKEKSCNTHNCLNIDDNTDSIYNKCIYKQEKAYDNTTDSEVLIKLNKNVLIIQTNTSSSVSSINDIIVSNSKNDHCLILKNKKNNILTELCSEEGSTDFRSQWEKNITEFKTNCPSENNKPNTPIDNNAIKNNFFSNKIKNEFKLQDFLLSEQEKKRNDIILLSHKINKEIETNEDVMINNINDLIKKDENIVSSVIIPESNIEVEKEKLKNQIRQFEKRKKRRETQLKNELKIYKMTKADEIFSSNNISNYSNCYSIKMKINSNLNYENDINQCYQCCEKSIGTKLIMERNKCFGECNKVLEK